MPLTSEQVLQMAPDTASAAAGRKLAAPAHWKTLGQSDAALWGECQGSALYQVKVDSSDLGYKCSCPSRKFPCKHVLGLLLLAAGDSKSMRRGDPPEWVVDWLASRGERAKKKEERKSQDAAATPADPEAAAKRAAKREKRVGEGIERLELWLSDVVRNGLAGLETKPESFWEDQAKSLVDA